MLRQARVESEAARQLAEEAKATRAEAESLEQEQKGIMARRGRYEPQVNQLTRLLPAASWFTVISAGDNILTIEGEAEYPQDVVAFAAAVQGQKDINSVRIAKLDKPQTILLGASQTRVAFNIVVTLKSAS
jgi:Tfp pilus assembly protein PilN